MDSWQQLVFGFGTHWYDGVLGATMFFLFGFLISWRNARIVPIVIPFMLQFVYGTIAMRYALSYIVFHHTLREGLWPFAWSSAAILGVWLTTRRGEDL